MTLAEALKAARYARPELTRERLAEETGFKRAQIDDLLRDRPPRLQGAKLGRPGYVYADADPRYDRLAELIDATGTISHAAFIDLVMSNQRETWGNVTGLEDTSPDPVVAVDPALVERLANAISELLARTPRAETTRGDLMGMTALRRILTFARKEDDFGAFTERLNGALFSGAVAGQGSWTSSVGYVWSGRPASHADEFRAACDHLTDIVGQAAREVEAPADLGLQLTIALRALPHLCRGAQEELLGQVLLLR